MNSSEITKAMKEWCADRRILIERCNTGKIRVGRYWMHLMNEGHPDVQLYLDQGKTLFIEIKTGKDIVRSNQEEYHEKLRMLGHDIRIIYSFQEFVDIMDSLGYT